MLFDIHAHVYRHPGERLCICGWSDIGQGGLPPIMSLKIHLPQSNTAEGIER